MSANASQSNRSGPFGTPIGVLSPNLGHVLRAQEEPR
jgi:hypothetical protein